MFVPEQISVGLSWFLIQLEQAGSFVQFELAEERAVIADNVAVASGVEVENVREPVIGYHQRPTRGQNEKM